MKVCPNCGAKYQEALSACPYCGEQNMQFVQEQFENQVQQLKKQSEEIRKLPRTIPQKSAKYLAIGAGVLLLVFLLLLVVVFIGNQIREDRKEKQEQANISRMEEYLSNEDFAGLSAFYRDIPYAYAVYDKYREVCECYEQYAGMKRELDFYLEYRGLVEQEMVLENLMNAMERLRILCADAKERMQDYKRLDNEQYIAAIKELGIATFRETLQVDEAMMEQVISNAEEEKTSAFYRELAKQIDEDYERTK